ncbi:hypothetical protein [Brevibacterium sp. UCMA 11754]|uniref:hypothetical protein n=1 Tax=Brevibacterium sp. UCMA 11754 TaxID=2749198 RepID=UPI001F2FFDE3|nr:hypothetical protein [Brevibacterium sp. UCMA 11754]MCF2573712.1 hypothetical protein [Brevibacterium sp. UCMA 11754]
MPPPSLVPTRLPAFRLLVLGSVLGLLVLALGPALTPAAAAQESSATESPSASAASTTASSATAASGNTGTSGEDSEGSQGPAGKTIVYGIPGLTINDIDPVRTPNLYKLFSEGAAANLNVRTIGSATCPGPAGCPWAPAPALRRVHPPIRNRKATGPPVPL